MGQIRAFVATFDNVANLRFLGLFLDSDYVAFTRFCRESGFVAKTRSFGFVLCRLLLRH